MTEDKTNIGQKTLLEAFRKMKAKEWDRAAQLLKEGLSHAMAKGENTVAALFNSTFGMFHKLKGEPRKAWKYYEQAERLAPNEPALKVMTSQMLVEQFAEFDTAVRKLQKIIDQNRDDIQLLHQTYTYLGMAYLGQGKKEKAVEALLLSMKNNFSGLVSAGNLNFKLVEALLKKKMAHKECREFLESALNLARTKKEERAVKIIQFLIQTFPDVTPGGKNAS